MVTPICAAAVGATLFVIRVHLTAIAPYTTVVRVTEERWWACALTGWAVLATLTLAGGVRNLARACLSAWLAAILTSLALIAHGAPAIYSTFEPLTAGIMTSSVLLFYLAVPTACLALVGERELAVTRCSWFAPAAASAAQGIRPRSSSALRWLPYSPQCRAKIRLRHPRPRPGTLHRSH